MIQQNNFQSLTIFFVFATEFWNEEKVFKENENVEENQKQNVNERAKKKRKMKNEMKKTMIFYLTRKSIFSNFFHFVIFALTFMFSLNELMLRTFFIAMYKIFDVLSMIDLQTMILQNKMILQNRFRWTKWFSKTIFKI